MTGRAIAAKRDRARTLPRAQSAHSSRPAGCGDGSRRACSGRREEAHGEAHQRRGRQVEADAPVVAQERGQPGLLAAGALAPPVVLLKGDRHPSWTTCIGSSRPFHANDVRSAACRSTTRCQARSKRSGSRAAIEREHESVRRTSRSLAPATYGTACRSALPTTDRCRRWARSWVTRSCRFVASGGRVGPGSTWRAGTRTRCRPLSP